MTAPNRFTELPPAAGVPWADVREWPVDALVEATAAALTDGGRLCAWLGVPEDDFVRLLAVVAFDAANTLVAGRSAPFKESYPALTVRQPQAHLFERRGGARGGHGDARRRAGALQV